MVDNKPVAPSSVKRILWAEDNEEIRDLLLNFAILYGFRIAFAETGTKALMRFDEACQKETPFCLVILDLALPDMAGHEVAARIREKEHGKYVRIMFCTAFDSLPNRFQAQDIGAYGFLTKPIDMPGLKDVLNDALKD